MRLDHVVTVARREFMVRVRTKGFWIGTVALPLVMTALMVVPSLMAARTKASQRLAVVDTTGRVAGPLVEELERRAEEGRGQATFMVEIVEPPAEEAEPLRRTLDHRVLGGEIDAWLWIDEEGLAEDRAEYHAESVSNVITQESLERALSQVVREMRLADAGYDSQEISGLIRSLDLGTVRITEEGGRAEGGFGSLALALGLFFMLYMVILIYGQQVLQGVLEEKTSRVVEVMLSSLKPAELMAGKLAGICGLGLVQLAIWIGTAMLLTAPGLLTALAMLPEDAPIPQIPLAVVVHFFFHFLMGYFLYASFYATLGAAFNDLQEAQQLSMVAVFFVVAPVMFLMPVINDPDSTLAVVGSLIPPFTPLVMMLRIAAKMPPWWQIALGYVLGFGFTTLMVAFAGRVYRVGVLMYGKKPTLKEIWRWARYAT